MRVQRAANGGRRDYAKQHACFYCKKLVMKIGRHLQTVHREEAAVRKLSTAEKEGRVSSMDRLRNLGDFNHNVDVLLSGSGTLIAGRMINHSGQDYSAADFLPCKYCLRFFNRKELWRHARHCEATAEKPFCEKDIQAAGKLLLQGAGVGIGRFASADPELLNYIITPLQQDNVSECIKSDSLLMLFAQVLFARLGRERAADIRGRLRYTARLALNVGLSVDDIIGPDHFDKVVRAVRDMCGETGSKTLNGCSEFSKPHVGLKLGQFLKKIAQIKRSRAIRDRDLQRRQDADDFLQIMDGSWCDDIASLARQSASEFSYNKKQVLPLTRDLKRLKAYTTAAIDQATKALSESPSQEAFQNLAAVLLCRLVSFNKRRPEEPAKLMVDKYQCRSNWQDSNAEILASLGQFEKQLMTRYVILSQFNGNVIICAKHTEPRFAFGDYLLLWVSLLHGSWSGE